MKNNRFEKVSKKMKENISRRKQAAIRQPKVTIMLANPRGFCAGVERAVDIVEKAIDKYNGPIYVRHEIVHNKFVVNDLKAKGAIFVEDTSEIPDGAVAIFSAHGVPEVVEKEAESKNLSVIDATCPLVTKVHKEAQNLEKQGKIIVLIGHEGHPEVIGTSGRVKDVPVIVISSVNEINAKLNIDSDGSNMGFVTQTTLSVDDTRNIIDELKKKYPNISGPDLKDICYATQNRQNAVRELASKSNMVIVIGSQNSSNASRLRDIAAEKLAAVMMIDSPDNINEAIFKDIYTGYIIGITAGASTPEILVQNIISKINEILKPGYDIDIVEMNGIIENVKFKIPKVLSEV